MQLEKEKADERNRQMEMQTEALMEERAKAQAEIANLQRNHNEILAKVELLESMYTTSDQEYSAGEEH